ncbi:MULTISPECIES: hypothetical protein [Rhodomicrobium]|uniref:hypothetical protein n=1 Tax=Rhodomicrobium TaxID=1068 RepID=UPI001483BFE8|nr:MULTISPECIES: hypothetical protein [Rhodomicrobium]
MANYLTHFSRLLDVGTPENAARALDLATGETADWINTDDWLAIVLVGGDPDA